MAKRSPIALKWVDDALASTHLVAAGRAHRGVRGDRAAHSGPPRRRSIARLTRSCDTPVLLPGRNDDEFRGADSQLDAMMASMIAERRAHPQERIDLLTKLLLVRDAGRPRRRNERRAGARRGEHALRRRPRDDRQRARLDLLPPRASPRSARQSAGRSRAFGPEGPTSFAPERLAYTTRVFKEALRLYPPLVILVRRSLEPFELQGALLPAAHARRRQLVRRPHEPARVERPRALRSRPLHPRARGDASQVGLAPVRRGPARVHRQPLRPHGGADCARHVDAQRALRG